MSKIIRFIGDIHGNYHKYLSLVNNGPAVLQRPGIRDGSLSVARVLKNAIDLIDKGEFDGVLDDEILLIQDNLRIILQSVD